MVLNFIIYISVTVMVHKQDYYFDVMTIEGWLLGDEISMFLIFSISFGSNSRDPGSDPLSLLTDAARWLRAEAVLPRRLFVAVLTVSLDDSSLSFKWLIVLSITILNERSWSRDVSLSSAVNWSSIAFTNLWAWFMMIKYAPDCSAISWMPLIDLSINVRASVWHVSEWHFHEGSVQWITF